MPIDEGLVGFCQDRGGDATITAWELKHWDTKEVPFKKVGEDGKDGEDGEEVGGT